MVGEARQIYGDARLTIDPSAVAIAAGSVNAPGPAVFTPKSAEGAVADTTPFLPNNRLPGTTPLFIIASLTYYAIWIAYLSRSKRVRNTFPIS